MADEVPASEIVGQAEVEGFDAEELEGAAVVDAFLIFRYQHPDWPNTRTAFIGSDSMSDELRIGLLTMVCDRIRSQANTFWVED